MPKLLNIVTRNDEFVKDVLREEEELYGGDIEVFDLTRPDPDYAKLLERIFACEKIHVW